MFWENTLQRANLTNLPDSNGQGTKLSVGKKEIYYYVTSKEGEINCADHWNTDRSPTVKRVSMNG